MLSNLLCAISTICNCKRKKNIAQQLTPLGRLNVCISVHNVSPFATAIYPLCSSVALFLIFPGSLLTPDAWIALGRRSAAQAPDAIEEIAEAVSTRQNS